jgi:hypothetical protein
MFDKPRKKSRWERFKEWCYYNDFWQKVGPTFLVVALIGVAIAVTAWVCEPEPGDLITEGVIIDMGHYVPGRSERQYGCWIKIRSDDGTVGTWAVSDTVYGTMSIGDWVEKTEVKP